MRRQWTAHEAELALAFRLIVTQHGCQVHDDPLDCEGPIQAAHVIPKQTLHKMRFTPEVVWDPRNGIGACYKAHRRSDAALERFTVPESAQEFAHELGLEWKLERQYGASVQLGEDAQATKGKGS